MPDWAPHIRVRLASLRLSPTRENEIVEELSQHLEDRWRDGFGRDPGGRGDAIGACGVQGGNLLARYMTPLRQAHAPAPIAPGAPAGHVLGDLWQDLRYAARLWLRQPVFAAAAVLSLALGIGVNTTMFTIVYGVLLRDPPYPEPDRLMRLVQAHSGGEVTMREYEIVKQHARTFEAVAAYRGTGERDAIADDGGDCGVGLGKAAVQRVAVRHLRQRRAHTDDRRLVRSPVLPWSHCGARRSAREWRWVPRRGMSWAHSYAKALRSRPLASCWASSQRGLSCDGSPRCCSACRRMTPRVSPSSHSS